MKVVKKTGLVPVHTSQSTRVFGVSPAEALKGLANGTVFLAAIPDDVETYEIDDGPKADAAVVQAKPDDEVVEIPDDWDKLHYMKIVVLAKQILNVEDLPEDGDKTAAVIAKEIVSAEVAKRAAAAEAGDSGEAGQGAEVGAGGSEPPGTEPPATTE
jgi:hypothetical protein